jgi:hypothetical protein
VSDVRGVGQHDGLLLLPTAGYGGGGGGRGETVGDLRTSNAVIFISRRPAGSARALKLDGVGDYWMPSTTGGGGARAREGA